MERSAPSASRTRAPRRRRCLVAKTCCSFANRPPKGGASRSPRARAPPGARARAARARHEHEQLQPCLREPVYGQHRLHPPALRLLTAPAVAVGVIPVATEGGIRKAHRRPDGCARGARPRASRGRPSGISLARPGAPREADAPSGTSCPRGRGRRGGQRRSIAWALAEVGEGDARVRRRQDVERDPQRRRVFRVGGERQGGRPRARTRTAQPESRSRGRGRRRAASGYSWAERQSDLLTGLADGGFVERSIATVPATAGNARCPDQGSPRRSARSMNSNSIPADVSRRMLATAACAVLAAGSARATNPSAASAAAACSSAPEGATVGSEGSPVERHRAIVRHFARTNKRAPCPGGPGARERRAERPGAGRRGQGTPIPRRSCSAPSRRRVTARRDVPGGSATGIRIVTSPDFAGSSRFARFHVGASSGPASDARHGQSRGPARHVRRRQASMRRADWDSGAGPGRPTAPSTGTSRRRCSSARRSRRSAVGSAYAVACAVVPQ